MQSNVSKRVVAQAKKDKKAKEDRYKAQAKMVAIIKRVKKDKEKTDKVALRAEAMKVMGPMRGGPRQAAAELLEELMRVIDGENPPQKRVIAPRKPPSDDDDFRPSGISLSSSTSGSLDALGRCKSKLGRLAKEPTTPKAKRKHVPDTNKALLEQCRNAINRIEATGRAKQKQKQTKRVTFLDLPVVSFHHIRPDYLSCAYK